MSPRQERALEETIRLLEHRLRRKAGAIAARDRAYADDLYQEALIHLWRLDPSQFRPDEIGYLLASANRHMVRLARRDAALVRRIPIAVRF